MNLYESVLARLLFLRVRQPRRIHDGVPKARLIGCALPRLIESGAMIDRNSYDGKSQRDVDTFDGLPPACAAVVYETDKFKRDMALIVIHGHNYIIPSASRLGEHGVGRDRPVSVHALFTRGFDRGYDLVKLLTPEKAVKRLIEKVEVPK